MAGWRRRLARTPAGVVHIPRGATPEADPGQRDRPVRAAGRGPGVACGRSARRSGCPTPRSVITSRRETSCWLRRTGRTRRVRPGDAPAADEIRRRPDRRGRRAEPLDPRPGRALRDAHHRCAAGAARRHQGVHSRAGSGRCGRLLAAEDRVRAAGRPHRGGHRPGRCRRAGHRRVRRPADPVAPRSRRGRRRPLAVHPRAAVPARRSSRDAGIAFLWPGSAGPREGDTFHWKVSLRGGDRARQF